MAEVGVAVNRRVWLGGYNASGDINAVALEIAAETVDDTRFNDTVRTFAGSYKTPRVQIEGYVSTGDESVDVWQWSAVGGVYQPVSVIEGSVVGSPGYFFPGRAMSYDWGGPVGEMARFSASAVGVAEHPSAPTYGEPGVVPVYLLADRTAEASSTQESGINLAYVTGDDVYAQLHVTGVTDTGTLTVKIQSDDNPGFTSATDRITFAAVTEGDVPTSAMSAFASAAWNGETYWRAAWTISGVGPTFDFAVTFGIVTP